MSTATERETIERAGRALIEAAPTPAKVMSVPSADGIDYRFLVIEQDVPERHREMARLSKVLGELLIPADVVVVGEAEVARKGAVKGTFIHEALREGEVIAES
jgi:hypothetical protein